MWWSSKEICYSRGNAEVRLQECEVKEDGSPEGLWRGDERPARQALKRQPARAVSASNVEELAGKCQNVFARKGKFDLRAVRSYRNAVQAVRVSTAAVQPRKIFAPSVQLYILSTASCLHPDRRQTFAA
jgi:hypothetical protein